MVNSKKKKRQLGAVKTISSNIAPGITPNYFADQSSSSSTSCPNISVSKKKSKTRIKRVRHSIKKTVSNDVVSFSNSLLPSKETRVVGGGAIIGIQG